MTDATITEPSEVLLEGDLRVACWYEDETRFAWNQVRDNPAYQKAVRGLGAGDVILDIGGHVGLSAVLFARQAPGATIVAVEPAPKTFECLRRTVAANIAGGIAVPAAVGATETRAELTFYPLMSTMSTLYVDQDDDRLNSGLVLDRVGVTGAARERFWSRFEEGVERHEVEVTTVSSLLRRFELSTVALVKIDVERAELDVLRGIEEEHWPAIRRFVMEVHDLDGALDEVERLLTGHGYEVEIGQEEFFKGGSVHMLHAVRR